MIAPVRQLARRRAGIAFRTVGVLWPAGYGWLVVVLATTSTAPVPLRAALVFSFVAFVPVAPFVLLLRRSDALERFVLDVSVNLALATVLATAMALAHWWSPGSELAALAAVATAGVAVRCRAGTADRSTPRTEEARR